MAWAFYATLNDTMVTAACVARDRDEYVSKALKLGADPSLRARVSAAIDAKSDELWGDMETVYEWAAFLSTATGRRPPMPSEFGWLPAYRNGRRVDGRGVPRESQIYYHDELTGPDPPRGSGYTH